MIYICTTRSGTLYGKLIRWMTGSEYNHTFLTYRCALYGVWEAVEINSRGVNRVPLERALRGCEAVITHRALYADLSVGLKKNKDAIGQKYDWFGVLGFAREIIASKFSGKETQNYWQNRNRLFCSEYAANVLRDSEAPGFCEINSSLADPGDILRIINENLNEYEVVELPYKVGRNLNRGTNVS